MKSHEYDGPLLSQMAQRLNAISFSMGFTKANEPEVLLKLSTWIQEHFGDIAMQEVALAFDLVTAKKIGKDIRHYNSFTQQYIGDVLHAFKTFRSKQIKLFEEHKKTLAIMENQSTGATDQEMYDTIKKIALTEGKIMKMANRSGAYNYAWKENLIPRMSDQERLEYKESIVKALRSEKRGGILPEAFNIDDSIQSECHKRILKVHFQEMIDKSNTESS